MKSKNTLIILFSFILSFLVFFGYTMQSYFPAITTAMILGLFIIMKQKTKISINIQHFLWALFALALAIECLYSKAPSYTLSFILPLFFSIILSMICANINNNKWFKYFMYASAIFGFIHVSCTIIYQIRPELINPICKAILKPSDYALNIYLMKYGGNPGITGQTGINGWLISIFIGILSYWLFSSNTNLTLTKKMLLTLLLILSIIALILTNKRSFIIFSATSIVLSYILVNRRKNKQKVRTIIYYILPIIITTIIVSNNNFLVFDRFSDNGSDITSGRYNIYSVMMTSFNERPMFGIGTLSTISLINNLGHNIYLQVLCENGLFVFLFFIYIIINLLTKLKNNNDNYKKFSKYVIILFLLYGLTGNPLYTIQCYLLLLIVIGYICKSVKKRTYEK